MRSYIVKHNILVHLWEYNPWECLILCYNVYWVVVACRSYTLLHVLLRSYIVIHNICENTTHGLLYVTCRSYSACVVLIYCISREFREYAVFMKKRREAVGNIFCIMQETEYTYYCWFPMWKINMSFQGEKFYKR